jgi:uncharacterized protein with PIN domain
MTRQERIAKNKELVRRILEDGLRHGEAVLSERDRQDVYVLELSLEPKECPGCGKAVSRVQAANEDFLDLGSTYPDDGYTCPHCESGLRYVLPFVSMGGYHWLLNVYPATGEKRA